MPSRSSDSRRLTVYPPIVSRTWDVVCAIHLESRMWMVFTAAELDFLRSQRIGRFATAGPSGWPHVMPVMYSVSDEGWLDFDVDGVKLRNITAQPRAAMGVGAVGPPRGGSVRA